MRTFFANVCVDILSAWTIIGCGAVAIQSNTAWWLKVILWFAVFVLLDVYVYIKNKIKY